MDPKPRGGAVPLANVATATTTSAAATAATAAATKSTEVAISGEHGPRRRAGGQKRKGSTSNNSSSSSKRVARQKTVTPFPHLHNGPITRARQSPNKVAIAASGSFGSAIVVQDAGTQNKLTESLILQPVSEVEGAKSISQGLNSGNEGSKQPLEPAIDAEFGAIRSRDANVHVVPTPAAWFSWTKTHPLEERALASFFDGKSEKRTPDKYMEIRNYVTKKYHADPNAQIESKDLLELSIGELDARKEIMEFLDHWGLINFHPFPVSDSDKADASADVPTKVASLIEKLYHFETVQSCAKLGPKADVSMPSIPPWLIPETAVADEVRAEGPAVEYHCNSCSADCSRKRFHCQKQADFDLCSECFSNGKFDSGMSPADFILMESAEVPGVTGGSWTDQETLLLLEALEIFGENWNEIAEHVATKSKAQCILHFLQMPIEDTFTEGGDDFEAITRGKIDHVLSDDHTSPTKDSHETLADRSASNGSSTVKESLEIMNKDATKNDSVTSNDAPETEKTKHATNVQQPLSPKVDISEPKDAGELNVSPETSIGTNFAINVLKEAFQAVGFIPGHGESLSFAEAGNPVMALAMYLAGLVDSDVVTASARSSLKALSEDVPGIQLAARHCFLLDDPPDNIKKAPATESANVEMVDQDTKKSEDQKEENNQGENQLLVPDVSDVAKDRTNQKTDLVPDVSDVSKDRTNQKTDTVSKEKEQLISSCDESEEKLHPATDADDVASEKDVVPSHVEESSNSALSLGTVTESGDLSMAMEVTPSTVKKADEVASPLPLKGSPSVVKELADAATVTETSPSMEVPKAEDMVSDSVPSEDKDPPQTIASDSNKEAGTTTIEAGTNTGEDDGSKIVDCNMTEIRDEQIADKLKRAAVTTLSAAAVKAKLFANQEEHQIRKLATFLIEKQLNKLETKMAFFSEMESMITRVREHMERSRQRLYHERAQIIATRLGLPASSSRVMPSSLPTGRFAMNYANSMPKSLSRGLIHPSR